MMLVERVDQDDEALGLVALLVGVSAGMSSSTSVWKRCASAM